jgi:hypothetical protein
MEKLNLALLAAEVPRESAGTAQIAGHGQSHYAPFRTKSAIEFIFLAFH